MPGTVAKVPCFHCRRSKNKASADLAVAGQHRIVLESVLRNCDGKKVRRKDVETLANWKAKSPAQEEIPFVVARIVLQDFTGVPLVGRSRPRCAAR